MKISLNWVKEYADVDLSVDELVTKIGAQLGAVEEVIDLGKRYQGIVIAKVVSCEKHPNADKLHVCKIDDGGKTKNVERDKHGYVQVVCGAPNVREGLLVAWLPPKTTVPSSFDKDPFVLEARDLRGVVSNGMLASASELAISDDHGGILELDDGKAGDDFAKVFGLDDHIIDVENKMFTHRPDCFGILGVAREIAGISGKKFASPKTYTSLKPTGTVKLPLTVKNNAPDAVPRLMTQTFSNIAVKPSPIRLQAYLTRVGIRPINNIVDITNYFMMLTGQPMHAYDYDKLSGSLETRMSKKGDKIKLLNGKEVTFDSNDTILITSKDIPIGIGGVMGGGDSEVDDNTKNIVLECASFDMFTIRRTSMKYGLFTDAVTRFNKGQSPWQCDHVLAWAAQELVKAGAVAEKAHDEKGDMKVAKPVRVSATFVNERLGLDLSADDMQTLLENVEFAVERSDNKGELKVSAPFWRTDIEISEDIVEEVGRLYGYDHLPLVLPTRSITPTNKDKMLTLKQNIRETLAKAGANEVVTYSFVHGNLLDKVGQERKFAYELSNALSPDLQYFRVSLTPSLLDKIHPNIKAGYDEFALFEINKTHIKGQNDPVETKLPEEFENLALVVAGSDKLKKSGAPYFQARRYLDYLAASFGISIRYEPFAEPPTYPTAAPYDYKRSANIYAGEKLIGLVGELKDSVRRSLKLPAYSAGFEIEISPAIFKASSSKYQPISKYPEVTQDVSLKVPVGLQFAEVLTFLQTNLAAPEHTQASWAPIDIYQGDDKKYKNITVRLTISSFEKTMTDTEVNKLLDDVSTKAHKKFGAERV